MRALLRATTLRLRITAFLQWWLEELRQLSELLLERVAPRLVNRVLVRFNSTGASVWSLRGRDKRHLLDVGRNEHGDWPDGVALAEDSAHLLGARAVLTLAAGDALVQEFLLPAAVEAELERVISLQLERSLPLRQDRVLFDFRIRERVRLTRQLRVEVWIAHRDQLERLRQLAQRWGLHPVRIAATTSSGETVGNFLPRRMWLGPARLSRWDRSLLVAATVFAILWFAVLGLQWGYERVKVDAELQRVHARAGRVRHVLEQIGHESQPAQELARISARADAIDVLTGLTETIPPDSWVTDLDVRSPAVGTPEMRLSGFAPAATTLTEILEKTRRFGSVRLDSATSAGLGSAMDRLQLSASETP